MLSSTEREKKSTTPLPLTGLLIDYQCLQFEQVPVKIYSDTGTLITKWVDGGMPRIPTNVLNCAFYLYETREDAESGAKFGGTGFFVTIPSKKDSRHLHYYAVTNYHVMNAGATTIRINTENGGTDILELSSRDWKYVPGGGDVAVCSVTEYIKDSHEIIAIPTSLFATKNIVDRERIGIGDDVFMVGRFIDHDGGPTNSPCVRFGNISVMPTIISMENGNKPSYCLDLHSRSGFSGSPVFVYRTPRSYTSTRTQSDIISSGDMYFLGIHWAQFPERWEIADKDESENRGKYVKGLSGMTCVMLPEPILEALDIQRLKDERARGDAELEKKFEAYGYPPTLE